MKTTNRILSVILCMLILLSVFMSAPFTVSAADNYTFEENGIRYLELDDSTLSVVDINPKIISEELVIPKTARNKAVTQIGANAFTYNRELKKVTVEAEITSIGDYAFEYCTYFTEINLPDSLTYIGKSAFRGSMLGDIKLPKKLETISSCAFYGCRIKQLTIPANVKTIGSSAFSCNHYLTDVVIEKRDDLLALESGVFEICGKLESFDFTYCSKIGNGSFYGCDSLTSITLPSHIDITSADGAFRQCSNLKTVNFPDNINFIPDSFFSSCKSLENINASKITSIGEYAFSYCEKLTNFDFTYCNKIGQKAFYNCTGFTSITLHDNMDLTSATGAFSNCTNLKTVNLPDSLNTVPDSFFSGCTSLEKFNAGKITNIGNSVFSKCTSLKDFDFSNCTDIGDSAFSGCTGFTSVKADKVTNIGKSAFNGCNNITDISFANCTAIGDYAFGGCKSLKNIKADKLQSIGNNAFAGCTSLTSFDFSTCTVIGDYAFSGCTGFTSISLPDKDNFTVGSSAFENCTNLKTVKLTNSIDTIPDSCFKNCTSLESIETGMVKAIGNEAFYNCENLVNMSFVEDNNIKSIYGSAFYNCLGLTNINLSKVEYISSNAFENCYYLTSVTTTKALKSIGWEAFSNCVLLKEICLTGVENINDEAFKNCYSLEKAETSKALVDIGTEAFYNCESLKEICLTGLTNIREYAFKNCYSLEKVSVGEKLNKIETQAFFNCVSLKEFYIPESVEVIESYALACFEYDGKIYVNTNFVVRGSNDSLADEFAKAYGVKKGLPAPVLKSASNVKAGIKVSFKQVAGSKGTYRIYRKTDGTSWKKIADVTGSSYTDTTAKTGTKYTYTVKLITSKETSSYDTTGVSTVRLNTPEISKITNVNDGMKITWNKSGGASSYIVYVKNGDDWEEFGTTTSTSITFSGFDYRPLISGKNYSFTVKGVDSSGKYKSGCVTAGWKNKYVAPPQITKLTNTETGVKITWGKVEGAEKYRVFVKSGSKWKKLKDTTSTSYTHTSVESGKNYTYTVRCISSTGKSYKSGYDTVGSSTLFLATPVVKSISNTVDGAKLTYTAVDGAYKYNIYVKSGSSWKKLGESTTNTFVHENAKSGTTYSYRVRAYDETLTYSSYYKTSAKNTFVAAPVIESLENTSKGVKITWGKVTGAEKYRVFVKSGSKWKKLKDTTSTSYTHTGVESGKNYTYTVRCISSTGKSYKSGYDTAGKSIVFEK